MNSTRRTIFIVSADAAVTQGCIHELDAAGGHYLMRSASSIELARREFHLSAPSVVFLDESAVNASPSGESLEFAVAQLTDTAPVVVAATPDKQALLSFLITSGAVVLLRARTVSYPSRRACSTVACVWLNGYRG
jgi:hypothetical protein